MAEAVVGGRLPAQICRKLGRGFLEFSPGKEFVLGLLVFLERTLKVELGPEGSLVWRPSNWRKTENPALLVSWGPEGLAAPRPLWFFPTMGPNGLKAEFPGLFLRSLFQQPWFSPVSTFCFPDVGNSRKINTLMTKRFLQLEPGEALKIEATSEGRFPS